jgi:multimeric flavodoxin WrbA
MNRVFIYYSLSGNGETVADYLSKKDYSIVKVETKSKMPKSMFFRILVGGFKASVNYKDKLVDFDTDISKYDEILIGSPIWNSRLSSPINTVLDKLDLKDKKIKFVLYSASEEENKATSMLKDKYNCEVINLKEPKKNNDELDKLSN